MGEVCDLWAEEAEEPGGGGLDRAGLNWARSGFRTRLNTSFPAQAIEKLKS